MEIKLKIITGKDASGKDIAEDKTYSAEKVKSRIYRQALEITENTDFNHITTKDLDALVDIIVDFFGKQFTRDELYDGLDSDLLISTMTTGIRSITGGVAAAADTFPAK